jgi:acetyl esterase/lipase
MSLRNEVAKLYVRLVFRDEGPFDPIDTQKKLNKPYPPKKVASRCEPLEPEIGPGFWVDKRNSERGTLLYLHGGAFYFGPVKEHWQYLAGICRRTGMAGIMLDYGLAPQNPYPVGMEQIVTAARFLSVRGSWAILGDSSGAAMAVAAVSRLKQMGNTLPAGLVLMSPWMDLTLANPAIKLTENDDVMMTVERLSNAAAAYAGAAERDGPDLSPMFAELKGLPPALIQSGTADLLLWDCRKFYLKCLDAGVPVIYEEYSGAFHDFMMLGFLPEAKKALSSQSNFLLSK